MILRNLRTKFAYPSIASLARSQLAEEWVLIRVRCCCSPTYASFIHHPSFPDGNLLNSWMSHVYIRTQEQTSLTFAFYMDHPLRGCCRIHSYSRTICWFVYSRQLQLTVSSPLTGLNRNSKIFASFHNWMQETRCKTNLWPKYREVKFERPSNFTAHIYTPNRFEGP